jgi:hypothetical protein
LSFNQRLSYALNMKKISVWLVLLLSIVTLGIYTVAWLVLRRREMIEKYQQQIPHWLWLIAPFSVFLVVLGIITALGPILNWSEETIVAATGSFVLPAVGLLLAIGTWWVWQFSKAAAYVTNGMVAAWTLLIFLFSVVPAAIFLQYYFNRAHAPKEVAHKETEKPSPVFILLALLSIVVSLASLVYIVLAQDYRAYRPVEREDAAPFLQEASRLSEEYSVCTDKLDKKFPKVTVKNEKKYKAGYNECEKIRDRQNEAAKKYNELIRQQ